ncbi:MAG: hypothetical protein JNK63_03785 [Chthonomonas sp.]|nr:hypothetical protein [Chthonomonas sp.]
MKKLLCGAVAAIAVVANASPFSQVQTSPSDSKENPAISMAFDKIGRSFVENKGQWDPRAVMVTRQPGLDFWVTKTGIVLDAYQLGQRESNPLSQAISGEFGRPDFRRGHVINMSFVGSKGARKLTGSDPLSTRIDWVRLGRPDVKSVPAYGEATVSGFLPGVDVRFYRDQGSPRYDLALAAGVNPSTVGIKIEGADDVQVGPDGSLNILTTLGWIRNADLIVYQGSGSQRSSVTANFVVEPVKDGFIVRFSLGKYDTTKPVVIDPIVYGTHFGGDGGGEEVMHAASDGAGNTYFTGTTTSTDLPIVIGPYGVELKDGFDGFFAQLTGDIYDAVYVAYVGTGFDDFGRFVDVDQYGNVWMGGSTMANRFPGRINMTIGVPQGATAPWGGTWGFTYGGINTADISYRVTAAQIKAALDALPNAPTGGFTVEPVDANGNVLPPASQMPNVRMRIRSNDPTARALRLRLGKRPYLVTPTPDPSATQVIAVDFTAFGFSPRGGTFRIGVIDTGTVPTFAPALRFDANGADVQANLRLLAFLAGTAPVRVTATSTNRLVWPQVEPVESGFPVTVNFFDTASAPQVRQPMQINAEAVDYGTYAILDAAPHTFLTLFKSTVGGIQAADDNAAVPTVTRMISGVTPFDFHPAGFPLMMDNGSIGISVRKVTQAQGNVEIVVAGNAAGTIATFPGDGNSAPINIPGTPPAPGLAPNATRFGYFVTFLYNNTTGAITVDNNRSKYIGGTGQTTISGVEMDAEGSIYLCGGVELLLANGTATNANLGAASPVFPTTAGGYANSNLLRQKDGWFRKYDPSGTMLISKVLGGSQMDRIEDIAVDTASNIYLLSRTTSFNFPRTVNAFSEIFPGGGTLLAVTKVNSTATTIAYSTSLATSVRSPDDITPPLPPNANARFDNYDLAVDGKGNAYIAGYVTRPLVGPIPVPLTPIAPAIPDQLPALDNVMPNGDTEGFLTVLNSTGGGLLFSTVVGESASADYVNGLYVDRTDAVYLAGSEFVTAIGPIGLPANFLSPFAFKAFPDGWDGWLAKLKVTTPILAAIATDKVDVAGGLGSTVQLQVLLQRPAPVGGATVTLRLSNPAVARFNNPVSGPTNILVTIPAGAQTFTQPVIIHTRLVNNPTFVDVRAELDGDFLQTRLNVFPWMESFTLGTTSIPGGESVNGTVTIFEPAPAGGLPVTLSADSGLVSFPGGTTVTIPAGEESISFEIASQGVSANTDVNITASAAGVGITQTLQLTPPGLELIEVNPDRVTGGESTTATVQVVGIAGPSTFVQISSTGAPVTITRAGEVVPVALPALVQIPQGQSTVSFQVNTSFVPSNTSANIIATLNGESASDTLFIEHVTIVNVLLSTNTCIGGDLVTGTVNISAPAGLTGMVIPLTNSNPAAGTVTPMTINIPPGATSGNFQIQTVPSGSVQLLTVATNKAGYVNKNATLTINPLIVFFNLSLNPTSVSGGAPVQGTISLPSALGINLTFTLTSSNPLVTFPGGGTVTIPAGQTTANFAINTGVTGAATDVLVSATLFGVSQSQILRVLPPGISNFVISPNLVNAGTPATGLITLDQPAPPGGLLINLTNNEGAFVSHQASITVPANQTTASFPISTFQVTRQVSVTFTATIPSRSQSYNAILTINPAP